MSINAGTILTLAGNNVIDRLQSAGLGDVRVPVDTIREVGNDLVVDKVPQDPDFTFTMESLDVTTDVMAFLTGQVGAVASGSAPGSSDPAGTAYKWSETHKYVNIVSPWKSATTPSSGQVVAGHICPGYYASRVRYQFGASDAASQTVELRGGSFFYGQFTPYEEYKNGDGSTAAFVTTKNAIRYRKGGVSGTTFNSVFGVIVDGVIQVDGTDYTVSGGAAGPTGSVATVTFAAGHIPAAGTSNIRFVYFSPTPTSFPRAVHADSVTKPGQVRGRNVCFKVDGVKLPGVQSYEQESTKDLEIDREFCNLDIVGITVNGIDTTGTVTVRAKDYTAFFDALEQITEVDADTEVVGWLNSNEVEVTVEVQNPKDPATILKTLYIARAKLQVPGTPARVNSSTDFSIGVESVDGDFTEYKGAKP